MPTMRKAGWVDGIVEEVSGVVGGPGFFLRDGPVDSLTLARFLEGGWYFFHAFVGSAAHFPLRPMRIGTSQIAVWGDEITDVRESTDYPALIQCQLGMLKGQKGRARGKTPLRPASFQPHPDTLSLLVQKFP